MSKALRGSFFVGGWWDGYFHSCLASSESVALYSARSAPVRGGRPFVKPRGTKGTRCIHVGIYVVLMLYAYWYLYTFYYSCWYLCCTKGTRGRGRGRAVAATPSEVEATLSPPPPQADSPEHRRTSRVDSSEVEATRSPVHEPRVDEPQVYKPSTHETRVPEASFQAIPEQSRDEGTSQETQWDPWPEPTGHAGSDEELGEGDTVYQRGSSGLPLRRSTRRGGRLSQMGTSNVFSNI